MTKFDGDASISAQDVRDRIAELEESVENTGWRVIRRSDGDTLGEFLDEEDAEAFITAEDYDPDKVLAVEDEADEDEEDELRELREFERDCRNTFGNFEWNSGITLRNGDSADAEFCEEYVRENYGSWPDELDSYINWSRYADDFLDGREYAELNGNYYYDL